MKLSKLFMVLGASLALSFTSQAQIVVPDAGVGPFTFDTTPAVGEFATFSIAGGNGDVATDAQMDAAVAPLTQAGIATVLATTATEPVSQNALFRRHTVRNVIFSRPTGNSVSVLKASLQNAHSTPRAAYASAMTSMCLCPWPRRSLDIACTGVLLVRPTAGSRWEMSPRLVP